MLTITIELGPKTLNALARMEKTMADLTTAINDLTTATGNVGTELSTLIADLKAAIAANDPAATQAAADAIEVQVGILNQSVAAAQQAATAPATPPAA